MAGSEIRWSTHFLNIPSFLPFFPKLNMGLIWNPTTWACLSDALCLFPISFYSFSFITIPIHILLSLSFLLLLEVSKPMLFIVHSSSIHQIQKISFLTFA
jgi:hypothetical protein